MPAIDKPKRLRNAKALAECRDRRRCELCGDRQGPHEAHHAIKTKGAGGPDLRENLACLCRPCHRAAQEHKLGATLGVLAAIIAARPDTDHAVLQDLLRQRGMPTKLLPWPCGVAPPPRGP